MKQYILQGSLLHIERRNSIASRNSTKLTRLTRALLPQVHISCQTAERHINMLRYMISGSGTWAAEILQPILLAPGCTVGSRFPDVMNHCPCRVELLVIQFIWVISVPVSAPSSNLLVNPIKLFGSSNWTLMVFLFWVCGSLLGVSRHFFPHISRNTVTQHNVRRWRGM